MSTETPQVEKKAANPIRNFVVSRIVPDHRLPDVTTNAEGQEVPTTWYITHIKDGVQTVDQCTEEVWKWAQLSKPWNDTRVRWIINADITKKPRLIVGVMRHPQLSQGPLSPRINIDPSHLQLQKLGSTFEPLNLPIDFQTPVLEEAVEAMNKAGNARVGEILGGKFKVHQVIDMDDTKIYVLMLVE